MNGGDGLRGERILNGEMQIVSTHVDMDYAPGLTKNLLEMCTSLLHGLSSQFCLQWVDATLLMIY